MKSMMERIKLVIKESLAAQTADILLDYLKQAEIDKQELEKFKGRVRQLNNENEAIRKQLREQQEILGLKKELENKAEVLENTRRELDIFKLKHELEESKKRGDEIKDLVKIIFQNPETYSWRYGTMPVSNNGYVETHNFNENVSTGVKKGQ